MPFVLEFCFWYSSISRPKSRYETCLWVSVVSYFRLIRQCGFCVFVFILLYRWDADNHRI